MADPSSPTRDIIERIVGNNPAAIRKFERLFEVAGTETPAAVADLDLLSGAIAAVAETLSALVAESETGVPPPADTPEAEQDIAPRKAMTLDSLEDVNAYAPAQGDLLQYMDGEWVPLTGATGSFLSDSGAETITVTNGVITAIT